ncbi:spore coat protein [Dethiothermospora halolimnae]|uniref:spore coat protein n=1 Tax=Dethiothermospora halolimnae TaxID=3114390 RepID=UPI003CCBBA5D
MFNKTLSEKDLLFDLMSSEKKICNDYNNALMESSCPVLRNIFSECLSNNQKNEFSLYDAIDKRGWIKTKLVSDREVKDVYNKFSNLI